MLILAPRPPAGVEIETGIPCLVMQLPKATKLAVDFPGDAGGEDPPVVVPVGVVGPRLATEGAFEPPPQPAARKPRPAIPATRTTARPVERRRAGLGARRPVRTVTAENRDAGSALEIRSETAPPPATGPFTLLREAAGSKTALKWL
jgi:hypothetical protein